MIEINDEIIDYLFNKNSHEYNLHKASEELQELSLVLTQKLLKPYKELNQEIIDEIGDVIIRINILIKIFDLEKINKRIKDKLSQYKSFKDSELYVGRI